MKNIAWKRRDFNTKIDRYMKYTYGGLTLILTKFDSSPRDMLFIRNNEGQDLLIRRGPFELRIPDIDLLELLFL